MGKIDSGDEELDQVLQLEAELLAISLGRLDDLTPQEVISRLIESMNLGSARESEWRFLAMVQKPEPPPGPDGNLSQKDAPVSQRVLQLVLSELDGRDPEEVVELLVESMDLPSTSEALIALRRE